MENNNNSNFFNDLINKTSQFSIESNGQGSKELIDIIKNASKEHPEFEAVLPISQALLLDDKSFDLLEAPILEELTKAMNVPSQKLQVAQSFMAAGYKLEELQDNFEMLIESVEKIENTLLPKRKIDFIKKIIGIFFNAMSDVAGVKRTINIPIELCRDTQIPKYAHIFDGGADIYAPEEFTLEPGEQKIIPIGVKVAIPEGYALLIQPRSGISSRSKLRISNTPGLIDCHYKDEIGVIVENIQPKIVDIDYKFNDNGEIIIDSILHGSPITIGKGERFAQMRLVEVPVANFYEVEKVAGIGGDRGGGFGSTSL